MAPVLCALDAMAGVNSKLCVTAQHRGMLDQVLTFFKLSPDHDLDIMQPDQSLEHLTARMITGIAAVLEIEKPDLVLVHGDTTTTFTAALAAFYAKIPVGHVEAGLRTGMLNMPWPEEANRKLTSTLAQLHFAPTPQARANLERDGVAPQSIHVTGNTVIDALLLTRKMLQQDAQQLARYAATFDMLDPAKRMILVTGHRRESFGAGFAGICQALRTLARRQDCQIIYPVHLNPNARAPVMGLLQSSDNIHLIAPQDYPAFVYLMDRSTLILTDSGGIQEEAPSLGKPVLVMREATERPEAIEAGTAKLVGTAPDVIVREAAKLLEDRTAANEIPENPYGDGLAAQRITAAIADAFALKSTGQ